MNWFILYHYLSSLLSVPLLEEMYMILCKLDKRGPTVVMSFQMINQQCTVLVAYKHPV